MCSVKHSPIADTLVSLGSQDTVLLPQTKASLNLASKGVRSTVICPLRASDYVTTLSPVAWLKILEARFLKREGDIKHEEGRM